MRKRFLTLIASILCVSCGNPNVPPEIKSFINAIDFRIVNNTLASGEFEQTYEEKINEETTGRNSIVFSFSKDQDDINFHALYTYEGAHIKNNVVEKEVTLTFLQEDDYEFTVRTNSEIDKKIINFEEANGMFYKIFDSGTNSYRVGGLYYGDFFAINMNKFYSLYSVNDDGSVLSMKENDAPYYNNLKLTQQIDIDKNGMLLYKMEKAYEPKTNNYGLLISNASYVYR